MKSGGGGWGRGPAVSGSPEMVEDAGSCSPTDGEPTAGPASAGVRSSPRGKGSTREE